MLQTELVETVLFAHHGSASSPIGLALDTNKHDWSFVQSHRVPIIKASVLAGRGPRAANGSVFCKNMKHEMASQIGSI